MNIIQAENIYLIGLGAIGATYASIFYDSAYSISIICDAERRKRYSEHPFTVNNKAYEFRYTERPTSSAKLILVCIKSTQLPEAMEVMSHFVSEDTIIVSLLNGISSEKILGDQFPQSKVVHAFTIKTDSQRTGQDIQFDPEGMIYFGSISDQLDSYANDVEDVFRMANIPHERVSDIEHRQWWKMMSNTGINQIQALFKKPYSIFKTREGLNMAKLAMMEVVDIARAKGISLHESDVADVLKHASEFDPINKSSMLQDVLAHRPTEIDIFAGEIIRQGKNLNIATPINQFLYHAIKYIEQKY